MLRQALTRPRHLVHKTKRRARGRKHQSEFFSPQRGQKSVSRSVFAQLTGLVREGNTGEGQSGTQVRKGILRWRLPSISEELPSFAVFWILATFRLNQESP